MVKSLRIILRIVYGDLHLDFARKGDYIICEMFLVDNGARFYEATIDGEDVDVVFSALNHAEYLQGVQDFTIIDTIF